MYLIIHRRANTRYQKTYQGRINHSVRQKWNCVKMIFKDENKPHSRGIFYR